MVGILLRHAHYLELEDVVLVEVVEDVEKGATLLTSAALDRGLPDSSMALDVREEVGADGSPRLFPLVTALDGQTKAPKAPASADGKTSALATAPRGCPTPERAWCLIQNGLR